MKDRWFRCPYCANDIHTYSIGGDIEKHNCKDRQIANLKEHIQEQTTEIMQLGYGVEAYRNEAADLKHLLAECRDVMEILNKNIPSPYRCYFCSAIPITVRHHPECPHTIAGKLLPKLKALGEI